MKRNRFFSLLLQIPEDTRIEFDQYIRYPLFNKSQALLKLWELVFQKFPNPPDKEKLFAQLYPGEIYRPLRLNNLLSDLLALLYEFLAIHHLRAQEDEKWKQVGLYLADQKISDHQGHLQKKRSQRHHRNQQRDASYYLQTMEMAARADQLNIQKGDRQYGEELQKQNDALDHYFFYEKLRIATDMMSRQAVINASYVPTHLPYLETYFETNPSILEKHPSIEVYFQAIKMFQAPDDLQQYQSLKQLVVRHRNLFPEGEQRTLNSYLLNYGVRKVNSGQSDFYGEILSLYQNLIQQDLLLQQGQLSQWTYINVVTAGLRLQDYSWTEQFIHQYKSYLDINIQENVYTYNLASLFMEKGTHGAALQLLQSVSFTDAFYNMAAKIMQLKIFFLDDEVDAFHSLILASIRFLDRNRQLSAYQKKSNQNFIKVCKQLFDLKQKRTYWSAPKAAQKWDGIHQKIETLQPLGNRNWLKTALQEMKR